MVLWTLGPCFETSMHGDRRFCMEAEGELSRGQGRSGNGRGEVMQWDLRCRAESTRVVEARRAMALSIRGTDPK